MTKAKGHGAPGAPGTATTRDTAAALLSARGGSHRGFQDTGGQQGFPGASLTPPAAAQLLGKCFKTTAKDSVFKNYSICRCLYTRVSSCAINVMIHCFLFFSFLFEKYTKRQELFCYFLMKTLLTLKYPVFLIVTNPNSKVHHLQRERMENH